MKKKSLFKTILAVTTVVGAIVLGGSMAAWNHEADINQFLDIRTSRSRLRDGYQRVKNTEEFWAKDANGQPIPNQMAPLSEPILDGDKIVGYTEGDPLVVNQVVQKVEFTDPQTGVTATYFVDIPELNPYKSVYNTKEEKDAAADALAIKEAREGCVLLWNDNNALPLAKESKVSLFGRAATNMKMKDNSGGGGARGKTHFPNFVEALEDPTRAKFDINGDLNDAYISTGIVRKTSGERQIGEASLASIRTVADTTLAGDYRGSAAIVVFAREGGESKDLQKSKKDETAADPEHTYISQLALHQAEKDLLNYLKEQKAAGNVSKVIVLINSGHTLEVKGMKEEYGVDACMVISGPGQGAGILGYSEVLCGMANPSGRLVDIYASNSLSAPATQNQGEYVFGNLPGLSAKTKDNLAEVEYYVVQTEGIYVGYKYYETRYEDCVLNKGNAKSAAGIFDSTTTWDYAKEVSYPFGYGLSYTTFEQNITSVTPNGRYITVKGTVKNTGTVAGKSVVEIYGQSPYTEIDVQHKVEKSAVQLVGFTKTAEIAGGSTVDWEITVDKYFLASWDTEANPYNSEANKGSYVLGAGDYYLALGSDSHDALNNILAKKGATGLVDHNGNAVTGDSSTAKVFTWNQGRDETTFKDGPSGRQVKNRLEEGDINNYGYNVKYVSRSDWQGTWPDANGVQITLNDTLINALTQNRYKMRPDHKKVSEVVYGQPGNLSFADMYGLDYDDPQWTALIQQMDLQELLDTTYVQGSIRVVPSINSPALKEGDGPDGIAGNAYVNESLLAMAWDQKLATELGEIMGEDAIWNKGPMGCWCPGVNTHRTPFGGRNFEYYSEDSFLAYELSGSECAALEDKGVSANPKHFFANDQETHRTGISTFGTEQGFREIQLRAFEGAFVKGHCSGSMTSFNRLGPVWVGAYDCAQDGVARTEWGFLGYFITDAAGPSTYMHTVDAIMGGTDQWDAVYGEAANARSRELQDQIFNNDDGDVILHLQEIAHRTFYVGAHTTFINGTSSAYTFDAFMPNWASALLAVDIVFGVIYLAAVCCYVLFNFVIKEKKEA